MVREGKSLKRAVQGNVSSGTVVTLPGYWPSKPIISITPNSIPVFKALYSHTSQKYVIDDPEISLVEYLNNRWRFTAAGRLLCLQGSLSKSTTFIESYTQVSKGWSPIISRSSPAFSVPKCSSIRVTGNTLYPDPGGGPVNTYPPGVHPPSGGSGYWNLYINIDGTRHLIRGESVNYIGNYLFDTLISGLADTSHVYYYEIVFRFYNYFSNKSSSMNLRSYPAAVVTTSETSFEEGSLNFLAVSS